MEFSFTHKFFVSLAVGLTIACLVHFYRHFVEGADRAVNAGYKHSTELGR